MKEDEIDPFYKKILLGIIFKELSEKLGREPTMDEVFERKREVLIDMVGWVKSP